MANAVEKPKNVMMLASNMRRILFIIIPLIKIINVRRFK